MLLTIIFSVCFVLAILWLVLDRKLEWETDIGAWVFTLLMGICFVANIVCLAVCPVNTRAQILRFEAARVTIQQQRVNVLTEYERATLTKEIVDKNQWLATEQFWAKNIWLNWFYDKSILDVKPIQ